MKKYRDPYGHVSTFIILYLNFRALKEASDVISESPAALQVTKNRCNIVYKKMV